MDDAVREIHGVHARQRGYSDLAIVVVREREGTVVIDDIKNDVELTPWQARYLAAKLYRLSRRIRARQDAES
jgi:hypothetical protein